MRRVLKRDNSVFGYLEEDTNWIFSAKGAPIGWIFNKFGRKSVYSQRGRFLGYLDGDVFYKPRLEIEKINMMETVSPVLRAGQLEEIERLKKIEEIEKEE